MYPSFIRGEPVWAVVDGFPWWPARIILAHEVNLAPGEVAPKVEEHEVVVEFFNDDKRFAVLPLHRVQRYGKRKVPINASSQLRAAADEAQEYADKDGWKMVPGSASEFDPAAEVDARAGEEDVTFVGRKRKRVEKKEERRGKRKDGREGKEEKEDKEGREWVEGRDSKVEVSEGGEGGSAEGRVEGEGDVYRILSKEQLISLLVARERENREFYHQVEVLKRRLERVEGKDVAKNAKELKRVSKPVFERLTEFLERFCDGK